MFGICLLLQLNPLTPFNSFQRKFLQLEIEGGFRDLCAELAARIKNYSTSISGTRPMSSRTSTIISRKSTPRRENVAQKLMINLCRQQLRAGLGNERKESARCEYTAGTQLTAALAEKLPPGLASRRSNRQVLPSLPSSMPRMMGVRALFLTQNRALCWSKALPVKLETAAGRK